MGLSCSYNNNSNNNNNNLIGDILKARVIGQCKAGNIGLLDRPGEEPLTDVKSNFHRTNKSHSSIEVTYCREELLDILVYLLFLHCIVWRKC